MTNFELRLWQNAHNIFFRKRMSAGLQGVEEVFVIFSTDTKNEILRFLGCLIAKEALNYIIDWIISRLTKKHFS